MSDINFRTAGFDDLPQMLDLFRETVLAINVQHYTDDQVRVWSAAGNRADRWAEKISRQHILIAEQDGQILGYGSLENDYIDLLYVHKDQQGKGIASMIYNILEGKARQDGMQALATDASFTAKAFFERKGFILVEQRSYIVDGVEISNCRMIKSLH
jgi:putative acetyltransferase